MQIFFSGSPLRPQASTFWLTTLIYIGNNPCERLSDYWVTSVPGKITPNQYTTKYITFRQVSLISWHIRTFPPSDEPGNNEPQNEVERMISRVQEWGDLVQAVSTQLLLPGTNYRLMRL